MYYIHDLYHDYYIGPFETQEGLCHWWQDKICPKAKMLPDKNSDHTGKESFLNVTGNDTYAVPVFEDYLEDKPEYYLRQYQVVDDDNRSIDIREWSEQVWECQNTERIERYFINGRKRNYRKARGPAMVYGTLRLNAFDGLDYEELHELNLPCPERAKIKIRKDVLVNIGDCWNYYEDRYFNRGNRSKSWKYQTKMPRQWVKHGKGWGKIPKLEETSEFSDILDDLEFDFDTDTQCE